MRNGNSRNDFNSVNKKQMTKPGFIDKRIQQELDKAAEEYSGIYEPRELRIAEAAFKAGVTSECAREYWKLQFELENDKDK